MAPDAAALHPVSRGRSLNSGIAWTLCGSLVAGAAGWGIVVLLARLGRPETVGEFSLAHSLSAPAFMLANLQLRALLATDAGRRTALADYCGIRIVSTGAALAVVGILMIASGFELATLAVGASVMLTKAFESFSDLAHGMYQQRDRTDWLGASMALRALTCFGVLGSVYWWTGDLVAACAGLALASAGIFLFGDLPAATALLAAGESLRPRFAVVRWRPLLRFALPLGITMLLISLQVNLPRLLIERWNGRAELGIFAALAWIAMAGGLFVQALGTAAAPRLAAAHVVGNHSEFSRLTFRLLLAAVILGLCAVLGALGGGREFLGFLYGPAYAAHFTLFSCLMASAGLSWISSALGYAATASRRIRFQPAAVLASLIGMFAGCWLLVPRFGLAGAGWAIFAAAVIQVVAYSGLFCLAGDPA